MPTVVIVGSGSPTRKARRERRWAYRAPCRVRVINPPCVIAGTMVGQTVNISNTGLALQISEAIPAGWCIEVVLPKGDRRWLKVRGTVVHSRRILAEMYEIGLCLEPHHAFVAAG